MVTDRIGSTLDTPTGQRAEKSDFLKSDTASSKSISIGIHRPNKEFNLNSEDFNLDKYGDLGIENIYLDPRPRIKNIVKELEEEHQWSWPPQPPKDFEKARLMKRKKWPALYNKECLDLCTFLSLIIGPWELLVAIGYMGLPKTFIPAMRESSEFSILFAAIFLIEGAFHTYAALLGLGLRSMRPYTIGFVFPSWPFEFVLPLLGIFSVFIAFYTTQKWRILKEMRTHLTGYNHRWYSKSYWDRYQTVMHCCGIEGFEDWELHGPVMEGPGGNISMVPESCCVEENCWLNATESSVHSMGCLAVTKMGTNSIFISATFCMLVGLFLSVMGYRSKREAEDFMGDPCHKLIFDSNSSNSLKTTNRALRRDELFGLLNLYSLNLGEELGLTREVNDVRTSLGILFGQNEGSNSKNPKPEPTIEDSGSKEGAKGDEAEAPNNPGVVTPDFLFDEDALGLEGSKTAVWEYEKALKETEEIPQNQPLEQMDNGAKSEELFQPDHVVDEKPEELSTLVEFRDEPILKAPSMTVPPPPMQFFATPYVQTHDGPVTETHSHRLDNVSISQSLVNLFPETPSEITQLDMFDDFGPNPDQLTPEPEVPNQDQLAPEVPTQDQLTPEVPTQDQLTPEPEVPNQDQLTPEVSNLPITSSQLLTTDQKDMTQKDENTRFM